MSAHMLWSVSLQEAVNQVSVVCEEDWRMGRAPEHCIELQSHRRECQGWPLCHWGGVSSQGAARDAAPQDGWLQASGVLAQKG